MKVASIVFFVATLVALVGCDLGFTPIPTSPHVPTFGLGDPALRGTRLAQG